MDGMWRWKMLRNVEGLGKEILLFPGIK